MFFRQLFDPDLAQYAYLIGCQKTGEALIIDPERDVDRYFEIASEEGLRLVAAAETHIHADFVSGARELAARGLRIYLSDEGPPEWQSLWAKQGAPQPGVRGAQGYDIEFVHDGDIIRVGKITLTVRHTPGHTPEHVAYLLTDHGGGADAPMGIASGDFLFVGDLGRPDLLESAAGVRGAMKPSAERLYRTVQESLDLPEHLQVWPGHGAGSACGKALGAVPISTFGYEKRFNTAIQMARGSEQTFVDFILDAQPEPPLYFARMKKVNKEGPALLGKITMPPALDDEQWRAAVGAPGTVILDTRNDRAAFLRAHIPGALLAPLGKDLCVVAGSYVEPGQRILLIAEPHELDHAVRCLLRIGLDDIAGFVTGDQADSLAARRSIEVTDFAGLAKSAAEGEVVVLDVRGAADYEDSHLPDAINIAHTRLLQRLDEVPVDKRIFVHCAGGRRAAYAAAFLQQQGREVVAVQEEYDPEFAQTLATQALTTQAQATERSVLR